jgi:hypothetical protein
MSAFFFSPFYPPTFLPFYFPTAMKKYAIIPLIFAFVIAFILQARSQDSAEKSLLYEISGKGIKTSYLLGTFHMLCEDDLFLTQVIQDKLKASEQLVLELDFDSPDLQTEMQKNMVLPAGKSLKDYLKGADYDKVAQFFKEELKMPLENLLTLKPFTLGTFLYPKYLACKTASWEMSLMALAQAQKAEILGLETVKDQFDAVGKTSAEIQVKGLVATITDFQKGKDMMFKMVNLYKAQDVDALYAFAAQEMSKDDKNGAKYMLDDRNKNWIPKIEKMSKEKASFYAVGAGHLGGKNGVINLLRKKGYTVKAIANPQVKVTPKITAQASLPTGEVAQKLMRTWKPDESMIPQMVEDVIENVKKQNPEQAKQLEAQKDMIGQMLAGVTIEYKKDGTFFMDIPSAPQQGSWKLADNDKKIIRIDETGKESTNEIIELTDKKLVVLKEDKKKMVYVAQ